VSETVGSSSPRGTESETEVGQSAGLDSTLDLSTLATELSDLSRNEADSVVRAALKILEDRITPAARAQVTVIDATRVASTRAMAGEARRWFPHAAVRSAGLTYGAHPGLTTSAAGSTGPVSEATDASLVDVPGLDPGLRLVPARRCLARVAAWPDAGR
jgi:hypothetical protein